LTGESVKNQHPLPERLGIVGSGTIARGLAAVAARHGPVVLCARSESSAERARGFLDSEAVEVTCERSRLAEVSFLVEAIVEEQAAKAALFAELADVLAPGAVLATTTSSLSTEALAAESGRADRFAALHVFNPVTRMALIELAFPAAASPDTRARTLALCEALGKTAVEVPDTPGFVVNRLLFPFLFDAVELLERTGMDAAGAARPRRPRRRPGDRADDRRHGAGADRRARRGGRARPQERPRLPHLRDVNESFSDC
jgi:3-hydroxybutyryl-CoA dehydrogenase